VSGKRAAINYQTEHYGLTKVAFCQHRQESTPILTASIDSVKVLPRTEPLVLPQTLFTMLLGRTTTDDGRIADTANSSTLRSLLPRPRDISNAHLYQIGIKHADREEPSAIDITPFSRPPMVEYAVAALP
jgi:hypothetical protein